VVASDNGVVAIGNSGVDQFIEKYSASGQLLWHRTYFYNTTYPGYLQQLVRRTSGFLVINSPNYGALPPKYLVLDEEGHLVAEKPAVWDYPYSLTADPDGTILAAGARLVKISPLGDTLWSRRYTRYGRAFEARAVAPLGPSGYLVAGTISNTLNRLSVLMLVAPDGQVRRDTLLMTNGGGTDVIPTGIVLDAKGNYLMGGYAAPPGGIPGGGTGNWAVQFAVALRNWSRLLPTRAPTQLAAVKGYALYPNPVREEERLQVLTPTGQPYQGAYDLLLGSTGQLVRRGQLTTGSGAASLLAGLPAGLYWLRLTSSRPDERVPVLRLEKR
jgi:hypothetical protein